MQIYDGDSLITYGAYDTNTHNQPITISSGYHVMKAKFNGMVKEQSVTLDADENKTIVFVFDRISHDFKDFWHLSPTGSLSASGSGAGFVGGGLAHEIFSAQLDNPSRSIICHVYGSSGASVDYDVSGSGSVTIDPHSIKIEATLNGTLQKHGSEFLSDAYISIHGYTKEYVDIPDSSPQGFTTWFFQYKNPNEWLSGTAWARSEEHYSKDVSAGDNYCYIGVPLNVTHPCEPDAVLSSVPYDYTNSGI